jgi:hypothetical protein
MNLNNASAISLQGKPATEAWFEGKQLFSYKGVVYEDDFSGAAGTSLDGRSPNLVNVTGNTYSTQSVGNFQLNGSGRLWLEGSGTGTGWARIALPSALSSDVIVTELVLRPRVSTNIANWIGIGLSTNSDVSMGSTTSGGVAWVLLRGNASTAAGRIEVFSGYGTVDSLYNTGAGSEAGFEGDNPSTLKLTYTVATGNLKVELGGIEKFNGLIAFGGTANTPAPLSAISHLLFQFNVQNRSTQLNPGYIDYLKVTKE